MFTRCDDTVFRRLEPALVFKTADKWQNRLSSRTATGTEPAERKAHYECK